MKIYSTNKIFLDLNKNKLVVIYKYFLQFIEFIYKIGLKYKQIMIALINTILKRINEISIEKWSIKSMQKYFNSKFSL